MDSVSVKKANSLYWLGRYTERAYKLSHIIREFYDKMVDSDSLAYKEFCDRLGICIDVSDKDSFLTTIINDEKCPSSIKYSMRQAYNNSIILREQIATETVAYIQLAFNNVMKLFNDEYCKIYDLQLVVDNLMSFWGAVDDYIIDDYIRDTIKAGKYVERIDLFTRFDRGEEKIEACKNRLKRYVYHLDTANVCSDIDSLLKDPKITPDDIANCVSRLFK